MKVILVKDSVAGKKNQVVEVSDGYAVNFLIKKNFAIPFNKNTEKTLALKIEEEKEIEEAKIAKANSLKNKLEKIILIFKLKVTTKFNEKQSNVHGSISAKQILKELEEKHQIKIERHTLENVHINTLGKSKVIFNLYKNVKAEVVVEIVKDE